MRLTTLNQLPLFTDEFVFRHLNDLSKKDALVIHNPIDALVSSPVFLKSRKSLLKHIEYIKTNNIRKAIVVANDIEFLKECPSLEYLWILPSIDSNNFDYSPVYELPNIKWVRCETTTGLEDRQVASVDYSRFAHLRRLSIRGAKGHNNVALAENVMSLVCDFGYPNTSDLKNSIPGYALQRFAICQAPIVSLSGIEIASRLQRLVLSYNRRLTDISALRNLKDTLVCLEIDTCGKITDFSALEELHNLEFLTLKGNNSLADLSFLKVLPKLKYLHVTMNVTDGDMSFCKHIPYVSIQDRKHYSCKNKDLPKEYSNPDEKYPLEVI